MKKCYTYTEDRGYEGGMREVDEQTYEIYKELDAFSKSYSYKNADVERMERAAKKLLALLSIGASTLSAEKELREAIAEKGVAS